MAILVGGKDAQVVSSSAFDNEQLLEEILAQYPELLVDEQDPDIQEELRLALVQRHFQLPNAGHLDLLFVRSDRALNRCRGEAGSKPAGQERGRRAGN